jgi:beta-barrel assembly-enhancing protease
MKLSPLFRRLATLLVPALALFAAPAPAQTMINLGSIVDAVKGVAQSQQISSMSAEEEVALGRDIAARTLSAYPLIRDEKLQRYVNTVGMWVAMQSDKPDLPWRFAGVQSDEVNAFAVPGGTVLITAGMLKLLGNEAELACVVGHEVGHIVRRHHLDLLQKELLTQSGSKLVADNLRKDAKGQLGQLAIGEGTQIFARSLDRGAERDADTDGVMLAARAGYDPAACLLLMQRMAGMKQEAGMLESLYKTHPQAKDRVADIGKAVDDLDGVPPGSGARPLLGYGK